MNDRTGDGQPARDAYEVLEIRPECSQVVVTAAYRALAALHHPDASGGSSRRMAELNDAYALIRTAEVRAIYDQQHGHAAIPVQPVSESVATGPIQAAVAAAAAVASAPGRAYSEAPRPAGVIDFGRYEGWSIADLARRDPDYLRWLRRHSSGIRYRSQIDAIFARSGAASSGGDALRRR